MKLFSLYQPFAAFILLAAFLAQTFSRQWIMMHYYANSAVYAKNCENKAWPQMHCNGKCQLMKKLKQEQKKDQENPGRKTDNRFEAITNLSLHSFAFAPCYKTISIHYCTNQENNSIQFYHSFFHPPQAA